MTCTCTSACEDALGTEAKEANAHHNVELRGCPTKFDSSTFTCSVYLEYKAIRKKMKTTFKSFSSQSIRVHYFSQQISSERRKRYLFILLRILRNYQSIIRLVLLIHFVIRCDAEQQRFAMEPQDQTAVAGSRVTLPCRVLHKAGVLQWTKDDFGLGTQRDLAGYERYAMVGSDEEGDYSLDIVSVTLEDDARYQCQVSSGPRGEAGIRSRYARLSVLVPPAPPRIVQGARLQASEDREAELECVSHGGKPPAEITWVDGSGGVLSGAIYNVEPLTDARTFTARSILKFTPRRQHHKQKFSCQAQNTADRTYRAAKIVIDVQFAPKVRVLVSGSGPEGRVVEGAPVKLTCKADANPGELKYRWYLNDQQLTTNLTTELIIQNASRLLHDTIVKCEVFNAVGKSEESYALDVSYAPRFLRAPASVAADPGAEVVLSCLVDANPPAAIAWLHYEQDRLMKVGSLANLSLTADRSTAGRYVCRVTAAAAAATAGQEVLEAEATLFLKGPPRVVSARTQWGTPGEAARVSCEARAMPPADSLVWSFAGRQLDADQDQDYAILEDPIPEGISSTLIIHQSEHRHFGVYACTVHNEYGATIAEIVLQQQDSFPLMVILFGVTSGIVLVIAFVLLFIVWQRRRRKRELDCDKSAKPDAAPGLAINGDAAQHRPKQPDRDIRDFKLTTSMEMKPTDGLKSLYNGIGSGAGGGLDMLHGALPSPYARYAQDYTTQAPMFDVPTYQEDMNSYVPFVDYLRDYNPPVGSEFNRVQLQSVMSNHQLNGGLVGSLGPASLGMDTVDAQTLSMSASNGAINCLGLPAIALGDVGSSSPINQENEAGRAADSRFAAGSVTAQHGRPLGGLQVHTAVPAATPAPPPYSRAAALRPSPGVRSPCTSAGMAGALGAGGVSSAGSPLPSAASTPASHHSVVATPSMQAPSAGALYILPPAPSGSSSLQLSNKGNGMQAALATHV